MRTKEVNSKAKQKLMDCAEELMLVKGFAATSVDEICAKAKLTKGSFFHYFKSKDDLGRALLERFCCLSQERMTECCCPLKEKNPLKRVYQHIDFAVAVSKEPRGCLLGTFSQELADTNPAMRSLCEQGFRGWAKIFERDLKEAKAKYAPRATFDPHSLAEYFIAIVEGSQILAKVKRDKKIIEKNLNHFRDYVTRLFKR